MRTPLCLGLLILLAIAQPAFAQLYSPCGDTYRRDSLGRGIESVFAGRALRPRLNDEGCFRAGVRQAREVKAANLLACDDDFTSGRADGLAQATSQSGETCYALGYDAGRADLDIGAREANAALAGDACVQAYRRGRADSMVNVRSEVSISDQPRTAYCYDLGWYEGPLGLP